MLSDRLTLAQRKKFGLSSEKYAYAYTQMSLFNEAEAQSDLDAAEPEMEEIHSRSYKRKKQQARKKTSSPLRLNKSNATSWREKTWFALIVGQDIKQRLRRL